MSPSHPQPTPHPRDLDLRQRLLAGDLEAASEFEERFLDPLYEFVHYRVNRDRSLTEDVVQDTMLVACDPTVAYDGRSKLYTWLCGIAKNKLMANRRKRRPMRMDELLDEADPEIFAILSDVERQPLPEEVLERRETIELVGASLSSLPPDYREALLAKYVDGLSVPDMARARGRHVKAEESQLFRARQAFARVFTLLSGKRGEATT